MSMEKIETYKVIGSDKEDSEVFAISLVEDPANLSDFVYMNKESKSLIKLSTLEEKRIVCGIVLIPEQVIPRYNEKLNKEYNLIFDEKEIFNLSKNFYKNGYQKNSNINHDDKQVIDGLTFFQSWIVMDPDNDTSSAYGFKILKKGTWLSIAYVEDDNTWERIKSGEVKGFSIEAFIDMEKIEMGIYSRPSNEDKNKNNSEKMSLLKKLIQVFSNDKEIKLATIESDKGPLTADAFELDNIVYQEVEGEMVPYADAEFIYEGKTYKTDAEGKITEIVDVPAEDAQDAPAEDIQAEDMPADAPAEASVEGEVAAVIIDEAADVIEEIPVDAPIDWELVAKELTKKLEEALASNEELSKKVEDLGKEPSATKLSSNKVEIKTEKLSKQGRIYQYLLSKG